MKYGFWPGKKQEKVVEKKGIGFLRVLFLSCALCATIFGVACLYLFLLNAAVFETYIYAFGFLSILFFGLTCVLSLKWII